jgi:Na+/H+ antiporter NhaA
MTRAGSPWSGRTAWARNLETPLRVFLRTETGSAAVLLAATIVALAWANIDVRGYEAFWHTTLSIRLDGRVVALDLREWVNSGLMTLFFFTVGLEARREFDLGELRERRRIMLPILAGVGGMVVPITIYLAVNAGRPTVHGWGTTMSTDTAFALGMLALVGPRFPDRLRAFMLTISVVDDLASLAVIAFGYTEHLVPMALAVGVGIFGVLLALRAGGVRHGMVYALLGIATWVAVLESGVDPIVVGLAMGLLTYAYPASRGDLERATDLFRVFREQPTPEFARDAQEGLASAISPNERLQLRYHPWTAFLIVPLFALANAGIAINAEFLASAYRSPVTIAIVVGYLAGKPIGIVGSTWLASRLSRSRLRPPVGWVAVAGAGTIAGIGFTVSLLVATLAFRGVALEQAKLGILTAALASSAITWLVFRVTGRLSPPRRAAALLGTAESIVDLAVPVDPEHDHIRGPRESPVTVVEYGDLECPYCGQAEPVVRELLAGFGDVRYVWRHLPLTDVHPRAQFAAEAAEAAAEQGAFWPMHDVLLANQDSLRPVDLARYAEQLGLDVPRFRERLRKRADAARVAEDVDSADLSGVSGTPTFFINGLRHQGAYDIATLTAAVKTAKARAAIRT